MGTAAAAGGPATPPSAASCLPAGALCSSPTASPAPPGARIVYIDGAFDLFHPGHVEILKVCCCTADCLHLGSEDEGT